MHHTQRARLTASEGLGGRTWLRRFVMAALAATVTSLVIPGNALAEAPQPAAPAAESSSGSDASTEIAISFQDQLLAVGVRLLVEAAVYGADLEEAKASATEKIRAKPEDEYRKQMNKIFDDLESVEVRELLGVDRGSSQKQVIAAIERAEKEQLLAAMGGIPDQSIADLLNRKLREKGASSFADAQVYFDTELKELLATLGQ